MPDSNTDEKNNKIKLDCFARSACPGLQSPDQAQQAFLEVFVLKNAGSAKKPTHSLPVGCSQLWELPASPTTKKAHKQTHQREQ